LLLKRSGHGRDVTEDVEISGEESEWVLLSSRSFLRELIPAGMTRIWPASPEQVREIEGTVVVIVIKTENALPPLVRCGETLCGAAQGTLTVEERTIKIIIRRGVSCIVHVIQPFLSTDSRGALLRWPASGS